MNAIANLREKIQCEEVCMSEIRWLWSFIYCGFWHCTNIHRENYAWWSQRRFCNVMSETMAKLSITDTSFCCRELCKNAIIALTVIAWIWRFRFLEIVVWELSFRIQCWFSFWGGRKGVIRNCRPERYGRQHAFLTTRCHSSNCSHCCSFKWSDRIIHGKFAHWPWEVRGICRNVSEISELRIHSRL